MPQYIETNHESCLKNTEITTIVKSKSGTIVVTFKKNSTEIKKADFFSVDIGDQHICKADSHRAAIMFALAFAKHDNNLFGKGGNERFKRIIDIILPKAPQFFKEEEIKSPTIDSIRKIIGIDVLSQEIPTCDKIKQTK
jgi:hypothetical protein